MRLVAWNANFNNRRRSFEEDVALLDSLNADVIVLSETARPRGDQPGRVAWIGAEAPGLGVTTRNGYTMSAHERNASAPSLFGGFRVVGPCSFNLLAAWPVTRSPKDSYHGLLQTSLKHFADLLAQERVILAGDLNTSSRVSAQIRTHPRLVASAADRGLTSIYHYQTDEGHGQEKTSTYRHSGRVKKEFHIDYCFLSKALLDVATLQILTDGEWETRSDHYPIVLDLRSTVAAK